MKNNKFFKALKGKTATVGIRNAYYAWDYGVSKNLDFPLLSNVSMNDDAVVADFLTAIEQAGFDKFGLYGTSTADLATVISFIKTGWKVAGIFKFEFSNVIKPEFREGLLFTKN